MVYKVPQFIEVEDKIFGPLTFKQFIYVAGGVGACFILWTFLPKLLAIIAILPVGGFAAALAFFKYNERPFVILVEAFVRYKLAGRLYLWKKEARKTPKIQSAKPKMVPQIAMPALSESRLNDLAWSLDVNESANQ